jgi:hypothetical protein
MIPVIEFRCVNREAQPMYACGHCRMLGAVIDRNNDRQAAEKCCLCENCGTRPREQYRTLCAECVHAAQERRETELRDRLNALPEEEYTGGHVYWDGTFYDDLELALDMIDEDDLPSAIIHPCDEGTATLPDLVSYVEEYFADQFDGEWVLPKDDEKILSDVVRQISPPRIWIPRENVRLTRSWLSSATEGADA